MKILITGGSGFIGQALCPALLAAGHQPCVLTRDPAAAQRRLGTAVAFAVALDQVRAVDAVINLQGENLAQGRWNAARKQRFRSSRVDFTHALVDWIAAQSAPPSVLVSGSAIGWYGDRGDQVLDESATPGDDFAAQLCRDWEAAAQRAEALGLRVCRVRIGVVLDPDGGALARMLPAFKLGAGGPLGRGRQWMSWIARADLVRLLVWLLAREDAAGVFNATAPEPLRQADFARALGGALHRPAVMPMPAFVLRALFGEMAELLLGSQHVLPVAAVDAGFSFDHGRIDAALISMLRPQTT
ncbi:TIGR01777 family oxidoreductase [Panacagrimonas sp.]|uniref:TIGR01777 family oxidoreductase n=1 Tax=Panacagrimonas sp. TaxID=2480088 RepID=UPI003B51A719